MIARLVALLFLLAILALAPAGAERRQVCSAAHAQGATVEQIMTEPDVWKGRCVAVTGMARGFLLYPGVEGYYRLERSGFADPAEDPDARGGIGLDNHRLVGRIPEGAFSEVTAIGRVQDCDEMREIVQASLGPDEIGWVSGYCHNAFGPVIWLTDIRVGRRLAPLRRMGEEARAAYGNLVFVPDQWPHRAEVTARAEAFLAALRSGDRRAFAELHERGANPTAGEAAVRLAFDAGSPFAEVARPGAQPQTAIFVDREDVEDGEASDGAPFTATICFCRERDCRSSWPIAAIDADNRPERPYACTTLSPFAYGERSELLFSTREGGSGLAEPSQTAFRRPPESSRR